MSVEKLLDIVAALRDPVSGCPWDRKQDFDNIAAYTLEEAYEVIDAIERKDYAELRDELGDLLLQVVFHAQIAAERDLFGWNEVTNGICEKMVRRHPHVFDRDSSDGNADEQEIKRHWEAQKARERAEKDSNGVLDGVARALPALKRAQKLQKRAAAVGFDWPDVRGVKEKIHEELDELERAGADAGALQEEIGDLLFACVNLARHLGADAESCLLAANRKFELRFNAVERVVRQQGRQLGDCSLQQLDAIWDQVKRNGEVT